MNLMNWKMKKMRTFYKNTGTAQRRLAVHLNTCRADRSYNRQQRLHELSSLQKNSVYNQVYPLQKVDYSRDVTDASYHAYVFVLLTSSTETNVESARLIELWRELAVRFGDVKFCQIRANLCIEGYPDKNTPTVLIYKDGDIKKQVVTLKAMNGPNTTLKDFETVLTQVGAVQHNDSRLSARSDDESADVKRSIRSQNKTSQVTEDDDSDWD